MAINAMCCKDGTELAAERYHAMYHLL
jgi:hypothetical protein